MNMNLDVLDSLNEKVESGEIKGFSNWNALTGEAQLTGISSIEKSGKMYFSFNLKSAKEGAKEFLVRIPSAGEKDNAVFMAMRGIKKTLFSVVGAASDQKVSAVFALATKMQFPIAVKYELRQYDTVSQMNGQTYTNQSLEALDLVSDLPF